MNVYRSRLEIGDCPAINLFLAEDDSAAVRAVFRAGAAMTPLLLVPITRIVVETMVLGHITATGECTTVVDRCLYDSDDLDLSILDERPGYVVAHKEDF